jgi:hypothetical protein
MWLSGCGAHGSQAALEKFGGGAGRAGRFRNRCGGLRRGFGRGCQRGFRFRLARRLDDGFGFYRLRDRLVVRMVCGMRNCSRVRRCQARGNIGRNGRGQCEVAAFGHFVQTTRCVESFLTMAAAHEAAARGELRRLDTEYGFAEGAARGQEHVCRGPGWLAIPAILMAIHDA